MRSTHHYIAAAIAAAVLFAGVSFSSDPTRALTINKDSV
jgi:hypothetical protein